MTRNQENKLSMWTTTNDVLNSNEPIWQELSAFFEAVIEFRNIRMEIDPQAGNQQIKTIGVTEDKNAARAALSLQANQMALNIEAYAIKNKNATLQRQFQLPPSQFDRLRDNTLPVLITSILEKARELIKELEPFGVTENKIRELSNLLDQYNSKNATPQHAKDRRKQATVSIAKKLRDGEEQLKLMDNMVGNFIEKYPVFVASYLNAREVINLGGGGSKKPKNQPPPTTDK